MKLSRPMLALLALPTVACDVAYEADPDATDAGGEVEVYAQLGALGADPQSGMMIEGALDHTLDDPELERLATTVVLGSLHSADGIRVVHGPNGPVFAGPNDRVAAEPGVVDAPISARIDRAIKTGRWLVASGRPVVVEGPDVDLAWATAEPSDVAHGPAVAHTFFASLPVAFDRLPESARGMMDATVRVFDGEREVCIARVTGFVMEARLVHEPLGPWDPKYSDATIFARGLRTLVAEVEPLGAGECSRGVVAVGVDAPSPALFREANPNRRLHDQAIDAMCALPAWNDRDRASDFEDFGERRGWERCSDLARRAEVRVFDSYSGERHVLVSDGGLHAAFAVDLKKLTPMWSYELPHRPEAMIDVHGDGSPELVMPEITRAPRTLVGVSFGGDAREPDFTPDWTPVPPVRAAVGGYAVPDFSVFTGREKGPAF